jgi:hypothetical protein
VRVGGRYEEGSLILATLRDLDAEHDGVQARLQITDQRLAGLARARAASVTARRS